MGQKVNPVGFRVGVYRDWDSRWFARDSYGKQVLEDIAIRKYLESSLENAEISRIEIEKAGDNVRVILRSGRPGVIIGKRGQEIESLRSELGSRLHKKNIDISVQEVKQPELDAVLVAKNIASQLVKRASYKKAMKRAAESAMRAGAKGIKICCAGRLQGAEIARDEWVIIGSVPLHTLRSDIDYALAEAHTTYGVIGVQVWICKGDYRRA
ncbi:MAG TPA: 30S ribosomal protein S3 [Candidatus Dependentiae bacterium]|nr:30S ribosomal protein S3 [Candidatus Dependentiae bacterium]